MPTRAYAAKSATSPLAPHSIERRALGPNDVRISIKYCGVCHSDLHQARNEWANTVYPCVPGHEIVGNVTAVGGEVRRFKEGDFVGVGCLVDSCGACTSCKAGLEQYCTNGWVGTYNGDDKQLGGKTFGGYSDSIVVTEHFVLSVPKNLDPAAVAPLLCAGITTYSPLRHFGVKQGQKVGIVGLGGLGHMGVKLAAAMGADVALITTSPKKAEDGRRLGAKDVVVSTDLTQMTKRASSFDFIIDTVSADHDMNALLDLLRLDGTLVLVGAPEKPLPVHPFSVIMARRRLAGSLIGGIAETQEMLDFCGKHNIVSDIELIPIQKINDAYERMLKGDVRYRFVIDSASLQAS